MTRFRIERFDPAQQIKEHRSILFVGRSGAGKTTCLIDWLRHLAPRFWCAVFFSPTLESANQFRQIAPSCFVYETALQTAVVATLLEIQRDLLREGKERSVLLCCDDSGFSRSLWRQDVIRALHMNGRHLRVTFVNCVQYCLDIPPDIRTQYSYVVATSENVHRVVCYVQSNVHPGHARLQVRGARSDRPVRGHHESALLVQGVTGRAHVSDRQAGVLETAATAARDAAVRDGTLHRGCTDTSAVDGCMLELL